MYAFTSRELLSRYRQTIFGVAWALAQSTSVGLLAAIVLQQFVVVPVHDGGSYLLLVLGGTVVWTFFARALSLGVFSLLHEQVFFDRVYFPREVLPLSRVLAGLVDFALGLAVFLIVAVAAGYSPTWAWLALPLPLLTAAIFATACCLAPAALHVHWRDVGYSVPFLLQLGFFAVPVLYPLDVLPDGLREGWAIFAPIVGAIAELRDIVLDGEFPDGALAAAGLSWAIVLLIASYVVFKRLEPTIADHV